MHSLSWLVLSVVEMKGSGRSSRRDIVFRSPARFDIATVQDLPNSAITCLQNPHGGHGTVVSATMAIEIKWRAPSDTALKSATLSAHSVPLDEKVSTLHPVKIPLSVRTAAPTRKREYGAYPCCRASIAFSISWSVSFLFTIESALQSKQFRIPLG